MRYKRVKFSTGRDTRVKYSTSMDWDEWEKKRRKYPVRYSTGEASMLLHSTGKELDKRMRVKLLELEKEKIEQKTEKGSNKKNPPILLKKISVEY